MRRYYIQKKGIVKAYKAIRAKKEVVIKVYHYQGKVFFQRYWENEFGGGLGAIYKTKEIMKEGLWIITEDKLKELNKSSKKLTKSIISN